MQKCMFQCEGGIAPEAGHSGSHAPVVQQRVDACACFCPASPATPRAVLDGVVRLERLECLGGKRAGAGE